jgi:NADPH2:quinone reductase
MAEAVFSMIERSLLRSSVRHRFPLSAAAAAHDALESRQTTGSIVLFA